MGYNIYYEGIINIDKPLDDKTYEIIMGLAKTRRMIWDAKKLEEDGIARREEIGNAGEFFFGIKELSGEKLIEFEEKYVINHNRPPMHQPELWCVWNVTEDRMGLIWNRNEKSYGGHEWLQYIVKKILVPRGYYPSGIINWFTERWMNDNEWHTIVEGNSVRKYRGYSNKEKEPDIEAWCDEEIELYERHHQEWIKNLMNKKIEFLHESLACIDDNTTSKNVLSFNIYFENNIVQVVFDRKSICKAEYLYLNLREENGIIILEEALNKNKLIKDADILKEIQIIIEKYISETPDYLEESIR